MENRYKSEPTYKFVRLGILSRIILSTVMSLSNIGTMLTFLMDTLQTPVMNSIFITGLAFPLIAIVNYYILGLIYFKQKKKS